MERIKNKINYIMYRIFSLKAIERLIGRAERRNWQKIYSNKSSVKRNLYVEVKDL